MLEDGLAHGLAIASRRRILEGYYEDRGWDIKKGVPTRERLIQLGLEGFVSLCPKSQRADTY